MEIKKTISNFALVSFIIIGVLFGMQIMAMVFSSFGNVAENTIDLQQISDSSDFVIVNLSNTISSGEGIQTFSSKVFNNSWIEINGSSGTGTIPNDNSINTFCNISMSLWVNPKATQSSQFGRWIDKEDSFFMYYLTTSDKRAFGKLFNETSSVTISTDAGTIQEDVWNNVAMSYNGTTIKLFKSGVLNKTVETSLGCINNSGLVISLGAQSNLINFYNGSMDEMRIYNSSLTDAEILEIYNSGMEANVSLPSTNLVLWASFNENQELIIYDKSSKGNNGSVSDPGLWETDGVNVPLVRDVDYTLSNATGLLVFNISKVYQGVTINWTYIGGSQVLNNIRDVQNNSLQGIVSYTAQSTTQFSTVAIAITLAILIALFLLFWVFFIKGDGKGKTDGGNFG